MRRPGRERIKRLFAMRHVLLFKAIVSPAGVVGAGFVLLCLVTFPASAAAVRPSPDVVPVFRHIAVNNGLAQSTVTAIAQDPIGYMWFATEAGLQRYDGYSFVDYRHDPTDPHSLSGGTISSLVFSDEDTLWAGGTNGLDRLAPGSVRFTHFRHQPNVPYSLSSNTVTALLIDHSDRLWVATAAGLDRLEANGHFAHYRLPGGHDAPRKVTALFQDRDGRIWVGAVDGLFYYDPQTDALRRFTVPAASRAHHALTNAQIEAIYQSDNDRLWIATRQGLVVREPSDGTLHFFDHEAGNPHSLPVDWVSGVIEDATGRIWVATYGGGLSRFDGYTLGFTTFRHNSLNPNGLSSNYLFNIVRDDNGLVWLGTDGAGVDFYDSRTRAFGHFRHEPGNPNSLPDNFIWAVYEDARHNLWVASDDGLTRIDPTRTHYRHYKLPPEPGFDGRNPSVKVLYADHENRLWLGTGHGLYSYTPPGGTFRYYGLDSRSRTDWLGASVNFVFEDSESRFWVGTDDGLVRLDPDTGKVLRRYMPEDGSPDSLPSPGVWTFCQAGDNSLWVGTTHGLLRFDPSRGTFTPPTDNDGNLDVLSASDILDCRMASDGSLWVGTTSGLAHFVPDVGTLHRYTVASGLLSAMIYSVLPDSVGDIWVGTSRGLARINPKRHSVRNYDVENALPSEEFNEGAAFSGSDKTLYFGSISGLAVVHLNALDTPPSPAPVVITGLRVMGSSEMRHTLKGLHQTLRLPFDRNSLSVQVAVLDFALPERNRFRYRLEGFDRHWHALGDGHTITYTNLPPGRYSLRVMGAGGDGTWSQHAVRFDIRILQPPWRTWWAYLLYAFAGLVALVTILYLLVRRIGRKRDVACEQRRRDMAEAQQALVEAVSPLQDESSIAHAFLERLPDLLAYDRAVFFVDEAGGLRLAAETGLGRGERERIALWPLEHTHTLGRLRRGRRAMTLSPSEFGSLERRSEDARRCSYLAFPLMMANGLMHVLLIGRRHGSFDVVEQSTAAILCNQLGVVFEKVRLIRQLEDMATTDSLTGVYTRRAFMGYAEAEFSRCARYGHSLSILMLDVDHFKRVNDLCGHTMGDEVLRIISRTCYQMLREPDLMGRYGGEEFVLSLPETNARQAREVAERIRSAVEQRPVQVGRENTVDVTISIGMATSDARPRNLADLIKAADEALFMAKRRGRNCVVVSD